MNENNLTNLLITLFKAFAEETKIFVDREFENKIKAYVEDLDKTKDELKELVKALDSLNFKEDGQIDVKVLTAKVASNEAAVAEIKNILATLQQAEQLNEKTIDQVKIDLESKIKDIKTQIENLSNTSSTTSTTDNNELKNLEKRVSDIENFIKIDVDEVKKAIQF